MELTRALECSNSIQNKTTKLKGNEQRKVKILHNTINGSNEEILEVINRYPGLQIRYTGSNIRNNIR